MVKTPAVHPELVEGSRRTFSTAPFLYEKGSGENYPDNFYQFALDHNKVVSDLNAYGFTLKEKAPFDGIKGFKDEVIHDDLNLALLPHPHPDPPLEGEGIIRVSSPSGRGLR